MRDELLRGREKRRELIANLEEELEARLLVYFAADSPIAGAKIFEDVLRPMYDHLQDIGHGDNLALYLYSRGGQREAPWKIISLLRRYCEKLTVVVPFRAHSAATMIAIGGDQNHHG